MYSKDYSDHFSPYMKGDIIFSKVKGAKFIITDIRYSTLRSNDLYTLMEGCNEYIFTEKLLNENFYTLAEHRKLIIEELL